MRACAVVLVFIVSAGVVVWHGPKIEAWTLQAKQEWERRQDECRVRYAEVYVRRGLEELEAETARVERNRAEQLARSEQARHAAEERKRMLAAAEQLTTAFDAARQRAGGQGFCFDGRAYAPAQAEAQWDRLAKAVLALRKECDQLAYAQAAHRKAAEELAEAAVLLREGRAHAEHEGLRLVVERDMADARATLRAARGGPASARDGVLWETMGALRAHIARSRAAEAIENNAGVAGVEELLRRRSAGEDAREVERIKNELGNR